MKKRSEVMAGKKSSAAERTIPLFGEKKLFEKPKGKVVCGSCDEEVAVEDLIENGSKRECSECGAPIELPKVSVSVVKKESTSSPRLVEKNEEKMSPRGDGLKLPKLPNTSETGVFCEECGCQWPRVQDDIWKICGHKCNAVDDPGLARQIKHLAGQPIPVVKKIRVVFGEQMYRVADYCTFRSPIVEMEAEVGPKDDYREVRERLFLEAKRQVDEAFHEIYESYMQKLGFIRDDLATRK